MAVVSDVVGPAVITSKETVHLLLHTFFSNINYFFAECWWGLGLHDEMSY